MSQKRKPSKLFWISLLIPILVLMSMLIKPVTAKMYGDQVLLATIPVDPRDLFYGDYVQLNMEIDEIPASLLNPSMMKKIEEDKYYGQVTVYVSLKKGEGGVYQAKAVSEKKPKGLYIKGKMDPYFFENSQSIKTVTVDYGIDRFYVEEGTGKKLEEQANKGKVLVSVKIYKGYPVVTDIEGIQSVE